MSTRHEMIDLAGRISQLLGLPRSTGQIFGLLYLATKPLSLDDLCEAIEISKGSASTGTRHLMTWGAIKPVWVPGRRKDYFEVQPDLVQVIRNSLVNFVKPRVEASAKKLESMTESLETERTAGKLTKEEYKLISERLKDLSRLQQKIQTLAPVAENFL
jgi:HTH-type transcriptional regulator, glycine betaine synthesis regulator